jgi:hypothetical protein
MNEKEKQIKNWILKNGYPLEMRVANLFQKKGFKVTQSIFYKDSDTQKLRELDVIAYLSHPFKDKVLNFSFMIECKKSTDKPWLIFKNENLINYKLDRYKPFTTKNASHLLNKFEGKIDSSLELLFPEIRKSGYNTVVAFKEIKDSAYSSYMNLLKACKYLTEKIDESIQNQCNFYVPIIVVEGELYDVYLDSEDELKFKQVSHSSMMNTKVFSEGNSSIVNIVSSYNLSDYIDNLGTQVKLFFKLFTNNIGSDYPADDIVKPW